MDISKIEEVINDQQENFFKKDAGITRLIDFKKYLQTKQITVITGLRRSGKSTLLKQFSKKIKNFYYINFDDERLIDFEVKDFNNLLIAWQKQKKADNILIDEIQNIDKWERFIRRVYDEGYKVFITGSNANLLSSELATHLTGRYFKIELYPFSFIETLKYKGIDYAASSNSKLKAKLLKNFSEYALNGGLPEYLRYQDKEFLKRTYEDIIYKDIITRFGIREIKPFRQLANYLFSNVASEISYNSLAKALAIKSPVTVRDYIGYLEESYLIFELYKYDFSLKKQYVSEKKIYVVDNGMRNNIAFYFSADKGKLLENLVFVELKRRQKEIFYFKSKKECDFLVIEKGQAVEAIQVTYCLSPGNRKREIDGLIDALKTLKLKNGIILTMTQKEIINIEEFKINVLPVHEWLSDNIYDKN